MLSPVPILLPLLLLLETSSFVLLVVVVAAVMVVVVAVSLLTGKGWPGIGIVNTTPRLFTPDECEDRD